MSTTQLVIKNKTPISPDDVKFITDRGQSEIRFLFPKTSPITADDKEVTFPNDSRTGEGREQVRAEENDSQRKIGTGLFCSCARG